MVRDRLSLGILFVLFVGCGACDLALEVLLLRRMGLLLGADGGAVGVVTALFMAGLGIGYAVSGRLATRLERPMLVLGVVEVGVGCCALAALFALSWTSVPLIALHRSLAGEISSLLPTLLLGAACVLPVTALMGASLPLGCAALGPGRVGSKVGILYGANLLGAALGPIAAGYWLLESLGIKTSVLVVAATCVVLGLLAVAWSLRLPAGETGHPGRRTGGRSERATTSPANTGRAVEAWGGYFVAFVVGGAAMAFQIIWIRALTPFIGATIHAFGLALSVYLLGTGLGSLQSARWLQGRPARRTTSRALAAVLVAQAWCLAAACLILRIGIQILFPEVDIYDLQNPIRVDAVFALLLAVATLFGVTMSSGAILPLVAHAHVSRSGRGDVGVLFGLNSTGAAVGALLALFVLLPSFGVRDSVLGLGAVVLGVGLLAGLPRRGRPSPRLIGAGAAAVTAFVALALGSHMEPMQVFVERVAGGRLVFYQEDAMGSAAVVADGFQGEDTLHLYTEGQQIAFAQGNPEFSVQAGLYFEGTPERAMVTGLGCGGSCEGMARRVANKVDCVELLGGVIAAQPLFRPYRGYSERPANVTYVHADARAHLVRTDAIYDIIFTDGRTPEVIGGYEFLTREFVEICAARLSPDGVVGMLLSWPSESETTFTLMNTLFTRFEWVAVAESLPLVFAGNGDYLPPLTSDTIVHRDEWERDGMIDLTGVLTDDRPDLMFEALRRVREARKKSVLVW